MNESNPLRGRITERGWKIEAVVRGIAGTLVLTSLLLSTIDLRWLWLAAFVGANLLQSSFTGYCLMSNFLAMAGLGSKRTA